MPFTAKSTLSYYSADMDEIVKMDSVWSISDDSLFYNDLSNNGLSISSDSDGTFRFYHMRGPHEPYYLSDDMKVDRKARGISRKGQARASLRIVYKYMDQLKELGIYDSATIIITADHGHTAETEGDTVSLTSEPIMFVKEAYSKGDEMKVSSAPVSQDEIFPTILRAAGIEANEYGRTFSEIGEEEKRIREYIDLYSNYMIRYKIDGNVKDIESWSIEKYIVE
jgi:phosphoglycerol transferase MdoB-like AlkP superfamily enzyme